MFFGSQVFAYLKVSPPEIVLFLMQNKLLSFAVYMILGSVASSLSSTGAYEVSLVQNGKKTLLYSALDNNKQVIGVQQLGRVLSASLKVTQKEN